MAAATSPATAEHGEPGKWLIAIAVVLAAALEVLDTTIINVSLPHMQGSFSASVDEITWVLTSYLVANGIMIPMTGWISARYGRKRYFLSSVLLFISASALCGLTTSLDEMVLFRLVQGAAAAAMIPLSQSILMETFPPNEQQMAMAVWGLGLMVAPIMGPTLGGWITDNLSWRWNFYINVPMGLAAFAMVSWFVHDPAYLREGQARSGKVDYLGIIYLALGLGLLQIVLDRGQRWDWFASKWIWYGSIISGLSLILLPFHELKANDPILDIRIFSSRFSRWRSFSPSSAASCFMALASCCPSSCRISWPTTPGRRAWCLLHARSALWPRCCSWGKSHVVVRILGWRWVLASF